MRRFAIQSLVAVVTFFLLGAATGLVLFQSAPRWLSGSIIAGGAAGLAGGLSWWATYSRNPPSHLWRFILAGIIAGIVCHPFYWFISGAAQGSLLPLSDLLFGSLFSCIVAGIVTIPAGIVAALLCRLLIKWLPVAVPRKSSIA